VRIKKILWPTDFSEPSYEALKVAKQMAQHFNAELYLVHVITPLPPFAPPSKDRPSFDVSVYIENLRISAEESFEILIDKKIGNKLKTKSVILHGDAAGEIARIANKKKIDLVVIASHGTTGWERNLVGSVMEKLVRICTTPMQIIRRNDEFS
jgi:nucleotide-binding universal stress UspA family protein